MYAVSSSWCMRNTWVRSIWCRPLCLSASVTSQVEPNWRHRQGGLSTWASCHHALFAFKPSWVPLLCLPLCTSRHNIWSNIRKLLRNHDDEHSTEVLAIYPYYSVNLFSLNARGLESSERMGYWLVFFGALCLWIRAILFWTWILVLWTWLLPTNSLPSYSTMLCHGGTLH